ncbi:non-ribosomal peptide synthetase [Mycobacteroides abscessus subsp. abscessus]|nr:non-ribosomal peptide synthetase [Mycobacteroides abscessus subsp. abscessus]
MWFLNRFDHQSTAYNIPLAVRLTGELDVAALGAAVADVVARHEVLRTVYPEQDGVPVQVVLPVRRADAPSLTAIPVGPRCSGRSPTPTRTRARFPRASTCSSS